MDLKGPAFAVILMLSLTIVSADSYKGDLYCENCKEHKCSVGNYCIFLNGGPLDHK